MTNETLGAVIHRFAVSDCSWLTTVRPDGRPHSAPVWHTWTNSHIYVVTMPSAVKVKNIRRHPAVVLTHPDPHRTIIIEGRAQFADHLADELRPHFKAKYDWDIVADEDYQTIIEIIPEKVLAWGEEGAGHRRRWRGQEVMAAGE
jgi:general stress protein 26